MRHIAAAADQIDCWIRRHAIRFSYGVHPSQREVNSARDTYVGLSAIGQSLKDQYDALATPTPRISLYSSSNSKRRNGASPLGTRPGGVSLLFGGPW